MLRFHIKDLRSMSPVTLEVHIQDLLRRPLGQIDPRTLVDMFALAEAEGLPRPTSRAIVAFAERMKNEIGDLPNGAPFAAFLADLQAIPAGGVPAGLRRVVAEEAASESRPKVDAERAATACASWDPVDPIPVVVASEPVEAVRVQRMSAQANREVTRTRTVSRGKAATLALDEDRVAFIQDAVFERLSGYSDTGLLEAVVLAGVVHQAKVAGYADMAPYEVLAVLRRLKDQRRVRHSAGRWSRSLRGW